MEKFNLRNLKRDIGPLFDVFFHALGLWGEGLLESDVWGELLYL